MNTIMFLLFLTVWLIINVTIEIAPRVIPETLHVPVFDGVEVYDCIDAHETTDILDVKLFECVHDVEYGNAIVS